ncbi:heavy metal translocating P-type ATPase [Mycolicibacterium sp. P9-64]|uniref:heavy metal translocating P-type ATPase n=1 Tax=Mycolicibacterium sp. P9-64 TaxID=2024612 RepID=UPI0011EBC0A5|nr:heavy metal translocating P-type ATPase [Mycolicibacterium sp. P9-64]KAA0079517.1 heavy metal translocating P-type ATPase [Mycolicibacterium sp. P9-64]
MLRALVWLTVCALVAGGLARLFGAPEIADSIWAAGTLVALLPAAWWVLAAVRRGQFGVDVIAVLSLLGTLAVGEHLAGALIAVMLSTGQALENAAERRATKDLRSLLERAPKEARRLAGDGIETVPLEDVVVGDVLVVGPGEMVPVDARITSDWAVLDESALTGETIHVELQAGQEVRSGTINAGGAIEIRATATAGSSTYAGIVRLAREAAATSAPVVRLADRMAQWFLPLTLLVAGSAWLWSGSAERAVAVLVVATPCPLLLAAPVAIVSGLSRISRLGVIVRGGGALENLGRATTMVLDKTGTVTSGRPRGTDIVAAAGWSQAEVLRLAASADQYSPHVLAKAIVAEAIKRGVRLSLPADATEEPGKGISATVDGKRVSVGNLALPEDPPPWAAATLSRATLDAAVVAWVDVDGQLVGAILLADPLRPDAPRTMRRLRAAGITRLVMLTGDRPAPAEQIGAVLGIDEIRAQQTPAEKVSRVRAEREMAVTVMVGDGVNDAPALAAATVGVAMGAHGSTASSEAADIVLTTDRLDRLADAMLVARRSRRIALQSAITGMVLSILAMGFAAAGLLPAAAGAILQEAIDLTVILNALRALRTGRDENPDLSTDTQGLIRRFSAEHDLMRDDLSLIRDSAHLLATGDRVAALTSLRRADAFIQNTLLPHEHAEDRSLYPALARPLGGAEATATMSRMHAEIDRLSHRLHSHLESAEASGAIGVAQSEDLLACLYGLHEMLSLHFATEEESYFALLPGVVSDG